MHIWINTGLYFNQFCCALLSTWSFPTCFIFFEYQTWVLRSSDGLVVTADLSPSTLKKYESKLREPKVRRQVTCTNSYCTCVHGKAHTSPLCE